MMSAGKRFGQICASIGAFNLLLAAGLIGSVWLTPGGAAGLYTGADDVPAPDPDSREYGDYKFGIGYLNFMDITAGVLFGLVGLPFALLGGGALLGAWLTRRGHDPTVTGHRPESEQQAE